MATKFQQYVQPAQELFNFQNKPYSHTQYEQLPETTQSSPYTPRDSTMPTSKSPPAYTAAYSPTFPNEYKPMNMDRQSLKQFTKLQRRTDQVFGIADLVSCILTLLMEGVMCYVLVTFYQTRNIPAPGRTGPWASGTKLWPTYMLAGAALTTFILSVVSLILMCRRREHRRSGLVVSVVKTVITVGIWATVIVFYRVAKTGKDLWGWSCSEKATAIQGVYANDLNFERLCRIQTSSWLLAIAEILVKIVLSIIGYSFHAKLAKAKKGMARDLGKVGFENLQTTAQ